MDHLVPGSDAYLRRQHVHMHNNLFGSVVHARCSVARILKATSVTDEGLQLAKKIEQDLFKLEQIIREKRVDPW